MTRDKNAKKADRKPNFIGALINPYKAMAINYKKADGRGYGNRTV